MPYLQVDRVLVYTDKLNCEYYIDPQANSGQSWQITWKQTTLKSVIDIVKVFTIAVTHTLSLFPNAISHEICSSQEAMERESSNSTSLRGWSVVQKTRTTSSGKPGDL